MSGHELMKLGTKAQLMVPQPDHVELADIWLRYDFQARAYNYQEAPAMMACHEWAAAPAAESSEGPFIWSV